MKKIVTTAIIMVVMFLITSPLSAQTTNPGDPGNDPEAGGAPPLGGGAPIGGGTLILMALGAAYGGKKLYTLRQTQEQE